ncbi:GTP-binding protein [Candidatus Thorarchaeota archaeon]|nr:MAG: GTP-binding protein [Candidatus Thorarchaeota archaeon]
MVENGSEYILKMVALGDGAVGKTSCIMRFTENSFGEKYKATIGTSIAVKNIQVELDPGIMSKIQIVLWDLAGQPSYKDLRSRYMVGSSMAFMVYDVTRPPTFMNIYEWYRNFRAVCPEAVIALVANKVDRKDRLVPKEAGLMLSKWLNLKYFETSAKTGKNIEDLFIECAKMAIQRESFRCAD